MWDHVHKEQGEGSLGFARIIFQGFGNNQRGKKIKYWLNYMQMAKAWNNFTWPVMDLLISDSLWLLLVLSETDVGSVLIRGCLLISVCCVLKGRESQELAH